MSTTIRSKWTQRGLFVGALVIGAGLVMGAGRKVGFEVFKGMSGGDIVSKVEVINLRNFDSKVALFDRTTGEIRRFHGSLDNPNVRSQWLELADGVDGKTSGLLDIQIAGNQIFLVDAVTGDTWILRERGSIYEWDEVRVLNK